MKQLQLILFLLLSSSVCAQIEGLWRYDQVMVGEEEMTPVAKWTDFSIDGTFVSGNGWMINGEGSWSLDAGEMRFSMKTDYWIDDPFGPFDVEINNDKMQWIRVEDGMNVIVHMSRADERPKAPRDWMIGLWQSSEKEHTLLIRWDHNFRKQSADLIEGGYWTFHAHKPEIAFLPFDDKIGKSWWTVEVDAEKLIMTNTHTSETLEYIRIDNFPDQ